MVGGRWGFQRKVSTSIPDGSIGTTQLTDDAVTNDKLNVMNANTVKVNNTASSANPVDMAVDASTVVGRKSTGNIVASQIETSQIENAAVTPTKLDRAYFGLLGNGDTAIGRWGKIAPGAGMGILAGYFKDARDNVGNTSMYGYRTATESGLGWLSSASTTLGGLLPGGNGLFRENNFTLTIRWQLIKNGSNSTNLWIGVSSKIETTNVHSTAFGDSNSCLLFGKVSGDSTWSTIRNDGGASATKSDTKTENETINTTVITGDDTNMTLKFNSDNAVAYSTEIPATTTGLGIIIVCDADSSTAKDFRILDIDLQFTFKRGV